MITGEQGSSLWKYGLDVDLKIGDPVPSPISGEVIAVGKNGGFGNQVKIRAKNGEEIWLSHLDGFSVSKGDKISAGQIVASGGNTGNTIPGKGGDGSHLDITIKKPGGGYYSAPEVKKYIQDNYKDQTFKMPDLAPSGKAVNLATQRVLDVLRGIQSGGNGGIGASDFTAFF